MATDMESVGTDKTTSLHRHLANHWHGVNCVARALYDNIAETPDELAFRKGDILTVLEQNTSGLEGWWLCSLRGRQGICPANRLRLMPRVYDTGNGEWTSSSGILNRLGSHLPTYASSPMLNSSGGSQSSSSSSSSSSSTGASSVVNRTQGKVGLLNAAVRAHQQQQLQDGAARALKVGSLTNRQGQIYPLKSEPDQANYDLPPSQPRPLIHQQDSYDIPRPHASVSCDYDVPRQHSSRVTSRLASIDNSHCEYDVPRPTFETYDSPRSHQGPATTSILAGQYDTPPPFHQMSDHSSGISTFSSASSESSAVSNVTSTDSESLSLSSAFGVGANSSNPSGRSSRSSVDVCDGPPSKNQFIEFYDVPKNLAQETYDVPPAAKEMAAYPAEVYDVPKPSGNLTAADQFYDTPPTAKRTLETPIPLKTSGPVQEIYDTPPPSSLVNRLKHLRLESETYDNPRPHGEGHLVQLAADLSGSGVRTSLALDADAAMETLLRLEQDVAGSLCRLVELWRLGANGEAIQLTEWQLRTLRLRSSLQELVDFAKGAIGNALALKSGEDQVAIRLSRLLRPLEDGQTILQRTTNGWSSSLFNSRRYPNNPDEMAQLKICCINLGQDFRPVTNFIRSNAHLLFAAQKATLVEVEEEPVTQPKVTLPVDDYDYVHLQSKAKFDEENEELKRNLPQEMKKAFDVLVSQSSAVPVLPPSSEKVSDSDRNVVEFYGSQAETYMIYLTNAIDAFILTIEHNQPPKVFVAYSKFVILNAHKLLCIGDTVHRNVANAKLKATVLERSNQLCQGLQTCVQSTKRAGREFPSVSAVQSMLDSVMAVSKLARSLKTCIVQAAGRN